MWERGIDEITGKPYWYNPVTGETRYTDPNEPAGPIGPIQAGPPVGGDFPPIPQPTPPIPPKPAGPIQVPPRSPGGGYPTEKVAVIGGQSYMMYDDGYLHPIGQTRVQTEQEKKREAAELAGVEARTEQTIRQTERIGAPSPGAGASAITSRLNQLDQLAQSASQFKETIDRLKAEFDQKAVADAAERERRGAFTREQLEVQRGNTLLGLGSRPETRERYLYALRGQLPPQQLGGSPIPLPGYGTSALPRYGTSALPPPAPAATVVSPPAAATGVSPAPVPGVVPAPPGFVSQPGMLTPQPAPNFAPGFDQIALTNRLNAATPGVAPPLPGAAPQARPPLPPGLAPGVDPFASLRPASAANASVAGPVPLNQFAPGFDPATSRPPAGVNSYDPAYLASRMNDPQVAAQVKYGAFAGINSPPPALTPAFRTVGGGTAQIPISPGGEPEEETAKRKREAGWNPFAVGGPIPEPVIGVGLHSGQMYSFGERGPETVVPEGKSLAEAKGKPAKVRRRRMKEMESRAVKTGTDEMEGGRSSMWPMGGGADRQMMYPIQDNPQIGVPVHGMEIPLAPWMPGMPPVLRNYQSGQGPPKEELNSYAAGGPIGYTTDYNPKVFNPPNLADIVSRGYNTPGVPLLPQVGLLTGGGQSLIPSAQSFFGALPSERSAYMGFLQDQAGVVPEDVTDLMRRLAPQVGNIRTPRFAA